MDTKFRFLISSYPSALIEFIIYYEVFIYFACVNNYIKEKKSFLV